MAPAAQEELWYSEVGAEILADFQPPARKDMWHPKYDHVSDWEYMCYVLKFHAGNIMGLILLIPCALCPSLESPDLGWLWLPLQSYVYNRKILMERDIRKKRDEDRQKIEREASEEKSRRMTWKAKTQADTINGKKQKEITDLWMNSCLTILLPRQHHHLPRRASKNDQNCSGRGSDASKANTREPKVAALQCWVSDYHTVLLFYWTCS
ncbi:unnamed protein product [Symbiodinium sp. CCMP2592]|nr:unnamed protein product [Symbiodinium sp. CCMP2592]